MATLASLAAAAASATTTTTRLSTPSPTLISAAAAITSAAGATTPRASAVALYNHVRDAVAFGFTGAFDGAAPEATLAAGRGHCTPKGALLAGLLNTLDGVTARQRFVRLDGGVLRGLLGDDPAPVVHSDWDGTADCFVQMADEAGQVSRDWGGWDEPAAFLDSADNPQRLPALARALFWIPAAVINRRIDALRAEGGRGLPASLAAAGFTPVEVEYRRRDDPGGTAPGPAADVAAAVTLVATTVCPDSDHGVWVGHSAGGTLVLDAAVRVAAALGLAPLVVGMAAVTDLTAAAADGLGDGHDEVERYLGIPRGSDGWAAAVAAASPVAWGGRYPPARQLLVAGGDDVDVPPRYVDHYVAAVGGGVHTLVLPGVDHYQLVEGEGAPWQSVLAKCKELLGQRWPGGASGPA
ncbi:hypothetical protein I4F81_010836 [Pyropia yezoensis]|uniref:Uncharacterized protein n=1 Tax=Pyropia yezoensis TaxID=2788 RepID=A0ACC3CF07_PYRYE|nr:hypothetical protein I4F81_010836 [Neopyropia yezoensis]